MTPGIHDDLTNQQYHAAPGISKSGLDLINRSPAHYADRYINGNVPDPTPAMIFGTAFHTAILEPQKFQSGYVVAPNVRRGTKAWDAFVNKHPGKQIIKQDDMDQINRMVEAVGNHAFARHLLASGQAERSVFWRDPGTDVLCKSRPDFWRDDGTLVDLKTTTDAGKAAFQRAVANYRYHIQAAFYSDGTQTATGEVGNFRRVEFCFVVVEKDPPHGVAVYVASAEMIQTGRRIYQENLALYADCLRQNIWPGYPETVQPIDLPAWAA